MGLIKEFREFAMRGNVVDLAVGVIIGAAFGSIVNSLVKDVIMPPLGLLMGGVDFKDKMIVLKEGVPASEGVAVVPAVTINYGVFINQIINFVIVAFAIFILVKAINTARRRFEKQQEAAPPGPTRDQQLLTEIRDLLRSRA